MIKVTQMNEGIFSINLSKAVDKIKEARNIPSDKKMVDMCLGKSIKPTDIPLGSVVYTYS